MSDKIYIEGTPADEECVQVSKDTDYMPAMRAECIRFIEMLRLRFPNCNEVEFSINRNPHDFGAYLDIKITFYNDIGGQQAYFIEENLPSKWSDTEVLTFVATVEDVDPTDY